MIILLNGAINAGKTIVGRRLAALLPRTAHVEVDALREFVARAYLHRAQLGDASAIDAARVLAEDIDNRLLHDLVGITP